MWSRSIRRTANRIAGAVVVNLRRVAPAWRIAGIRLRLQPAKGQAPPIIVATVTDVTRSVRTLDVVFASGRLQVRHDSEVKSVTRPKTKPAARVTPLLALPTGTPGFAKTRLVDVAQQVGLNFRQDAFHFSMLG